MRQGAVSFSEHRFPAFVMLWLVISQREETKGYRGGGGILFKCARRLEQNTWISQRNNEYQDRNEAKQTATPMTPVRSRRHPVNSLVGAAVGRADVREIDEVAAGFTALPT